MEGFDTLTMSTYLAQTAPMSMSMSGLPNVTSTDLMLPLDSLSNFDQETFVGSEDATQFGYQQQHTPSLKRFPSGYEDPFSDALSTYDQQMHHEQNGLETTNIDRDHKLLGFSLPSLPFTLLDYTYRRTSISMSAQLHGMFFLAESPWAAAGDYASPPPTELTCYRRNLFQVTGNLTLPRGLRYVLTDQGDQVPILAQELTISAAESVEGNPVKIISVPWKTPATSVPVVEDKSEKEPSSNSLDLMNGQEPDSEFVNFPIAWKRLQFRIATANNGRRKELQQHFVVHLKVIATLSNGARVSICEVQSGAIIVRGRSPRNFQSRKDYPIAGTGSAARKNTTSSAQPQLARTVTGDSNNQPSLKQERPPSSVAVDTPQIPFKYPDNDVHISPDFFEWKIPDGHPGAMTALPDPSSFQIGGQDGNGAYAQSSPDLSRAFPQNPRVALRAPISLSLTDDERKTSQSPSEPSKKVARLASVARAPSFSINMTSSPDESADLLYEYFPLGLDDWMPPVDAVYRPHVVHHMALPSDPKAAAKGRSKRYFTEDQP